MTHRQARRRSLRVILAAVLACLAVVVLPYEAWASTVPSGWVWSSPMYGASTLPSGFSVSSTTTNVNGVNGATFTDSSFSNLYYYCGPTTWGLPSVQNLVYNRAGTSYGGVAWAHDASIIANSLGNTATQTVSCGSSNLLYGFYMVDAGGTGIVSVGAPIVASTCSNFTSANVTYVGTTLTAYFKWTGTPPAGGFRIDLPGGGALPSGAATGAFTTANDGTPGEYGGTVTVTLSGVTTTSGYRISKATDLGCYTTGTVSSITTSAVSSVASNGTDSSGYDCGLNPFCYVTAAIQWAFVPSSSWSTTFASEKASIAASAPVAFATGSVTFFTSLLSDTGCSTGSTSMTGGCTPPPTASLAFDAPGGGASMDPLLMAGQCMQSGSSCPNSWGPIVYTLMRIAIVIPFAMYLWRRFAASLGSKEAQ